MTLCVDGLCKSYNGRPVLRRLSFTAGEGITCIMGPSGGGKTTLLRILLGLEKPDSGTVTAPSERRWAAVFQEDRLLEHLDAMGNLRFALGPALGGGAAEELLAALGLSGVEDKRVRDYSGGMKRRLALARALLAPADALALDEPFAGLDGESRARAISCIREAAQGKLVLLVTHDEGDARALGADIVRLSPPFD